MSTTAEIPGSRSLQAFELLRGIARWGSSASAQSVALVPAAGPAPVSELPPEAALASAAAQPVEEQESAERETAVPEPAAAPLPRTRATVLPYRKRFGAPAMSDPTPFDFELARLELLQSLALNRVGDQAVYDDRDILQRAILEDSGRARMFVEELVRRITSDGDKTYDVVVSLGEFGAVFGARLADALIERYGNRHVGQRFLEAFTLEAEDEVSEPQIGYRLKRSRSDMGHLLSGKRIVFAVPTITPETWPEVFRQAQFLRGPQTNSDSVRIVSIARVGQLRSDAPHGLKIDAIVDYR